MVRGDATSAVGDVCLVRQLTGLEVKPEMGAGTSPLRSDEKKRSSAKESPKIPSIQISEHW